jgi:predicted amidohydrolase YtcJ
MKDELFSEENFAALPTVKASSKGEKPESLMISGGIIRPMIDGLVETVPAIGFANGAVVVIGSEQDVNDFMQQNYPGFASKELQSGQTLLPGLIEPHIHLIPTAILMGWLDVGGFNGQDLREGYGIPMVTEAIRQAVPFVKPNQWLLASGLDPALMPLLDDKKELVTISIELLDDITLDVPLMIMSASMHTLYLNTPALQEVFHNKKNKAVRDRYITFERYKNETNGQLQEAAGMDPAMKTLPKIQLAAMFLESFKHLKQIFQTANERGVTFMYDAGMSKPQKQLLDAYLLVHQRAVRIGAAQVCGSVEEAEALPQFKAPGEYKDIFVSHVKVISDGSNQGLTGYQSEAYLCKPENNYGIYNFGDEKRPSQPPTKFQELMETIIAEKGWPVMIHANGNLAVQFAVQAYEQYIPLPLQGIRHRIEHCSLITQDQLQSMKQLGISPSFLIGHVGYWGYAFQEAIFGDKTSMLDLCKSALNAGMKITLHSDNQVSPLGPLRMMEQSITRIMEADPQLNTLNAAECITAEQALRAITYDAAWQCYAEQWTGSLKVGNFADFVILEQDPLTIQDPYMNMRNIDVLETWVGGLPVYNSLVVQKLSVV